MISIKKKEASHYMIATCFWCNVSKMRVELTRPIGHYPLKVARLPIPPPGQKESERRDSDPRPRPWQGRALPTELLSQSKYCFQYRTIVKFKERWAKDGTRTRDPDLGKVVLYQLSYFRSQFSPLWRGAFENCGAKIYRLFELTKFFARKIKLFFHAE